MFPERPVGLYHAIYLYLDRQHAKLLWSDTAISDLAYQIHATHTGKLDLFRHHPRPMLDPKFTLAEATSLVHNYLNHGSCKPIPTTQNETTL